MAAEEARTTPSTTDDSETLLFDAGCCICGTRRTEWKHQPTGREFCNECASAGISYLLDRDEAATTDPAYAHFREALADG